MNPFQAMMAQSQQRSTDPAEIRASSLIIYRDSRGVIDILSEGGNLGNTVEVRNFGGGVLSVRTVHTAEAAAVDHTLELPKEGDALNLVEIYKTTYIHASEIKRIVTDPRSDQKNSLTLAEGAVKTWRQALAEAAQ